MDMHDVKNTHNVQVALPPQNSIRKNSGTCKLNNKRALGSTDQGHCRLNLSEYRCMSDFCKDPDPPSYREKP